jgi:ethanolamine utilization protein EutA
VLCDSLFEVLERCQLSALTRSLLLTPEIDFKDRIDAVLFSGGVSEYIYGLESRDLGDLGSHLGRRVYERAIKMAGAIALKSAEVRIRATVIGASQYTVQVSGNTIFVSDPRLLPLRNLQVVTPQIQQKEPLGCDDVRGAVQSALNRYDIFDGERAVALAIHWELGPSYPLIRALAEGVGQAMKGHIDKGQPLVLVFDADIAKLIGNLISKELFPGLGIVSIDGVDLKDFDFIDIGEELPEAKAVPVVIKSLIFRHREWGRGHAHKH